MEAKVAEAAASARYNESAIAHVAPPDHSDDGQTRELILVPCLDEDNGGIVFCDAGMGNDGGGFFPNMRSQREDPGIVRHLRTKRWALPMLNDQRRTDLYDAAIKKAVTAALQRKVEQNKNSNGGGGEVGDETDDARPVDKLRVLDIGSGTGLLAMMAAKHTCEEILNLETKGTNMSVQVTSAEMAPAMARLARLTIRSNGREICDRTRVVDFHTGDDAFALEDVNPKGSKSVKADVCTSELLESGLLGEGVLPALRDAYARHLAPDAIVVPRRARVYAVLVEGLPFDDINRSSTNSDGDKCVGAGADGDNDAGGDGDRNLNSLTALISEDLSSFENASGGVWLAARAKSDKSGSKTCIEGILRGGEEGEVGFVVPVHADALLDPGANQATQPLILRAFGERKWSDHSDYSTSYQQLGIRPLSDHVQVLDFDFASGPEALPPKVGRSIATEVRAKADGTVDGVLFWWELDLWDDDGEGETGGGADGGGKTDDGGSESNAGGGSGSGKFTYSTKPRKLASESNGNNPWQDHWQQCLFVFADGRSTARPRVNRRMTKGQSVELVASHDDSSISFSVEAADVKAKSDEGDSRPAQRRRLDENGDVSSPAGPPAPPVKLQCKTPAKISSERALQLNDSTRTTILRRAILHALDTKGRDASLLDVSDFGLAALIAAVAGGATNVISLESASGETPRLAAEVAQLGNGLPKGGAEFTVINARAEHLRAEHLGGGGEGNGNNAPSLLAEAEDAGAQIVASEPYYAALEGWHLQEALNLLYTVRGLKSRGVVAPDAVCVPAIAYVYACGIECHDIDGAYGSVGGREGMVAGFEHGIANHYGDRYGKYDVALPLWQYKHKRLTSPFRVARIVYEGESPRVEPLWDGDNETSDGTAWQTQPFGAAGTCHAVAFWVEYLCRAPEGPSRFLQDGQCGLHDDSVPYKIGDEPAEDPEGGRFDVISTFTPCHRQAIRKLPKPVEISEHALNGKRGLMLECSATFGKECDPKGIEDHDFQLRVTCDWAGVLT